ncbi:MULTISPECIES: hypothetical protein [unclassified Clostridium]|uniref:hypothetical protein n=1 Tax=unclassified Clostridium TaxID=2614128 RepID=UPI0002986AF0|nr:MULTISPECIES: hypothetical protein [unclassified Clostridium]EKQ57991.1 MAG: hypothetical protein A370_00341 [Clostridium sp. Maddingley MBC34-26]
MQTKKLAVCNYHINIIKDFQKRFNFIKKSNIILLILTLLLITIVFTIITDFSKALKNVSSTNESISEFKSDISILSDTAKTIESERQLSKYNNTNAFGSDGNTLKANQISPGLKTALGNMADINNDRNISEQEISALQIMRLNADDYQKELERYQYTLQSADHNLKNYVIITNGKYAGTVLYNGPLKYTDSENRRYFGLELFY